MAKIVAKIDDNKFLLEINQEEIKRINRLQGIYEPHVRIGTEVLIGMKLEALRDDFKKLLDSYYLNGSKAELEKISNSIRRIEELRDSFKGTIE